MRGDEILRIIRRITRDFAPLLPGLRLEVVSPEGFKARVRGKPIIADEATLRAVLVEEAAKTRERGGWPPGKPSPGAAGSPGPERSSKITKGEEGGDRIHTGTEPAAAVPGGEPPEGEDSVPPKHEGRKGEGGEEEKAPEVKSPQSAAVGFPLYALPSSRTIMVEMESITERVNREDRRLQRPLVEGMILREVIYLATSCQPFPDPRARAETILRRHWPFQYAALRSVGLTVTGFERPPRGRALGRDN